MTEYIVWFIIFLASFIAGHLFHFLSDSKKSMPWEALVLIILAPLIFSWKMVFPVDWIHNDQYPELDFWDRVIYWPFKLIVVTAILWLICKWQRDAFGFYGVSGKNLEKKPYFLMLLFMLPLIAIASTQPDFLRTYPKLYQADISGGGIAYYLKVLLFELSYGSDFFTIELFFRGFLVIAFAKWFGMKAILPMAMFYCTIHFGKPIGECISSYFGGIILGVITYHSRSIFGGLIVHVGIAWLMELGGALGNLYK